ncbi:uncharacterized protein LOC116212623 isoform X2 [Punica granatum]|uniref:ETFB lysine methyltransferase n=1 Tax=Punica granatum TaxID=22663 RepID=A0A6P8ECT4_PUNGR|nr:uncharacterized protein LOC116212623 isoform X2 [Punica granatum]
MSASHFVKQLFRFNSRHYLARPPSPSSLLLSCLSSALSRTYNHRTPYTTDSRFSSGSPSSSCSLSVSSETAATEPFSSSYLSVRIQCRKDEADVLSEALLCFGASSISIDEEDGPTSSDEISIDSVFSPSEDVGACISNAADSIGLKELPKYEVERREQEDWITKSQESFHPVEVTEGLWIVPEWRAPPDVNATNIILNPGLAFGTGEHPTTSLCLQLLRGLIRGGEHFLDYGTGSGVLAIAALKLGAGLAVGIDIDPVAISSARQNAALNNIGPGRMRLHLVPDNRPASNEAMRVDEEGRAAPGHEFISEEEMYDIIIANILLNPLLELADQIISYAKPGAVVGISGSVHHQSIFTFHGRYISLRIG